MTDTGIPAATGESTAPTPSALRLGEKVSYGVGDLAISATWTLTGSFLLVYWSDVALLPVAALGPLMLIVRVFDAVFDPIVGLMVDRTKTRWGKARPYLLWAALPFALLSVAAFSVPTALSANAKVIYTYIVFVALNVCYSLVYIPYGSMLPMLTRDRRDNMQMGSYRSMGTSFASILVYGCTLPIVAMIDPKNRQAGFTVAAIIFGTLTVVVLVGVTFCNCKERFTDLTEARTSSVPLKTAAAQMVRNPLWWTASGIALLLLVKMFALVSSFIYFARDVLGDASWVTSVLSLLSVAILLGGFTASITLPRIGLFWGNMITIIGSIVLAAVMPLFEGAPVPFFGLFLVSQFGGAFQAATIFILVAEAVDFQARHHGTRSEGLMTSSVAFATKLGMAIGASITAFTLGWTNYQPGNPGQAFIAAIRWQFYGSQIACLVLMLLCMLYYRSVTRDECFSTAGV